MIFVVSVLLAVSALTNSEWVEIPQINVEKQASDSWSAIQQSEMFSDFLSKSAVTKNNLMSIPSKNVFEKTATTIVNGLNNESFFETTTPFIVTTADRVSLEETTGTTTSTSAPTTVKMPNNSANISKRVKPERKHITPAVRKIVLVKKPKIASKFGINGIISYIKNVQKHFVTSASQSIQDKVKLLKSVRDEILLKIEDNILTLWPLKTKVTRMKRDAESPKESPMNFPSTEGALMTISFLTFAVFLIKLVLQVVNTIKSKHYSYNGFEVSASGAGKIVKKMRNARRFSYSSEDMATLNNVMKSIN